MACQRHKEITAFQQQFCELLNRLGTWLKANAGKVHKSFVTVRDGGLLFLLVRNSVAFDAELEDALTDLDLATAQDSAFDLIELNVLALPMASEESYRTFLAPSFTWAYDAE